MAETLTPIVFWTGIYGYDDDFDLKEFSSILDHALPTGILLFEFFTANWLVYQRQTIMNLLFIIYVPVNVSYAIFSDDPLYSVLPWDTIMSYVFAVIMVAIVFCFFAIYSEISKCRYKRYPKSPGMFNIYIIL